MRLSWLICRRKGAHLQTKKRSSADEKDAHPQTGRRHTKEFEHTEEAYS